MNVVMVTSKVKQEHVVDAQAATEKVIQALEQAQPAGVRYAVTTLSDGVTIVAFLELGKQGEHPPRGVGVARLRGAPREPQPMAGGPPAVENMTVIGPPKTGEFSIGHAVASRADVDALLTQAQTAGATLTQQLRDRPWGIYAGYFRDPDAHLWEILWNPELEDI
jgi:catechol 2,3-dioxygenase-like lactoylglutathione lyase family enzyme